MKGQWFLISAVVATGVFLTISTLFRSYLSIDTADIAEMNEDNFLSSIEEQFSAVVQQSSCANLDRNLREFRAFSEREMANIGYLLYLDYTLVGCAASSPGILLASDRMVVCQNLNSSKILPQIDLTCATA